MISVVIPTMNRAELLRGSLESLANQNISSSDYEVVVVNDGSTDKTSELCQEFSSRMQLKYLRIENSGISAAKNLGIFLATNPIVLFFDDDDVAHPNLLSEHIKAHADHPSENVAVLGYTTWHDRLSISPLMDYVVNIGQNLFAYRDLQDGQSLAYHYFWGGRSSCKRSLLVQHGIFDQRFRFIIEDIELGYRLWKKTGLSVVYCKNAISHMMRPLTYDQFCRRCERQGEGFTMLAAKHTDPAIQEYCRHQVQDPHGSTFLLELGDVKAVWEGVRPTLEQKTLQVYELESLVNSQQLFDNTKRDELARLYRWTFNAFKIKGIAHALRQ